MKLGNALTDWSSSQKNRESEYSTIKSHLFYTINAVFIFILNEIISYMGTFSSPPAVALIRSRASESYPSSLALVVAL